MGLNATMPVAIWPLERPEPVTTSEAGIATSSAYHWFGVDDFSRSSCTVCWPPCESESGTWMLKSGCTPVALLLSYIAMLLLAGL